MAEDRPVVYIFHGDDSHAIQKAIAGMVAKLGDSGLADLNLTRLDGRSASEDDLRSAALSMPFLAERRIVLLANPLARFTRGSREKRTRRARTRLPRRSKQPASASWPCWVACLPPRP